MSKEGKSRKPLLVGVIAAVLVLVVLLVLLLTQCTGGQGGTTTAPTGEGTTASTGPVVVEDYTLYWNVDRALYDGMSEAGMSSRQPESDGYYHVRFFAEGQMLELKVADRKVINSIDVNDVMGLEFDSDGIVIGMIHIDDMPVEQVGWKFYVQSVGGNLLKLNSAKTLNGMEVLMEITDKTGIWDMSGMSGEIGAEIIPTNLDRVIALANKAGELTHVFVYDRSEFMLTEKGYCQHCDEEVEWTLWNKENAFPNSTGHYKLQNNVQMPSQLSMAEDVVMCVDLNGFAVDGAANKRVLSLHNVGVSLALMDTSEAGTGAIRGHGNLNAQGGVVWVRYGQFHLYSGTVDGSDVVDTMNGVSVYVAGNSFFYMNGGTIIGGTAKYSYDEEKNSYGNGLGGAVYVAGKMVMNDGEIRDGEAVTAISGWDNSGKPKYTRGIGGNIYVSGSGELEIHGGTVKNGRAGHSGGNIYLDGACSALIDGGTISGGHVTGVGRNGGNVYVNSKATLTLSGGYIVNGYGFNCAGNLYVSGTCHMNGGYIGGGRIYDAQTGKVKNDHSSNVYLVNGQFHMYGGEIKGGFQAIDTDKNVDKALLVLGGVAQIWGSEDQQFRDLNLLPSNGGVKVVVAKLLDAAKIGVYATTGVFTRATDEVNTDNFFSNIEGAEVVWTEQGLALGRYGCVCGVKSDDPGAHLGTCGNEQLYWQPIVSSTMPTEAGNYYLVSDIQQKAQLNVPADGTVRFDLNGYTLTANPNFRAFTTNSGNENSKLVITDTSEAKTGTVKTTGHGYAQGNLVWVTKGSFELYGGTLDGSEYTLHAEWQKGDDGIFGTEDDKTGSRKGGGVVASKNTTINIYGGTIIGNTFADCEDTKTITVEEDGEQVKKEVRKTLAAAANGAALYAEGSAVINLWDGEIHGGTVTSPGGNIYLGGSSVLNMYGGKALGGVTTKQGGNIVVYDSATLNILGEDVLIADGQADGNGGNIWVGKTTGVLNMEAGTITGGTSVKDQGGNLFISGKATITGGSITGGKALNNAGGNIAINSNQTVSIANTVIADGEAKDGGNIGSNCTQLTGETIVGEGTTITGGKAANRGGNVYLAVSNYEIGDQARKLTFTVEGGEITGGTAGGNGDNLFINDASGAYKDKGVVATLNIQGGTIDGGVYLNTDSVVVNISGAPVIHKEGDPDVQLNGAVLNLDKLKEGTKIGVTGSGIFTNPTEKAYVDYFLSNVEGADVVWTEDGLGLGGFDCLCRSPKGQCLGGDACDGTLLYWQPWLSGSSLPAGDGNYYLLGNVTLGSQWQPPADSNIALDLNGYEVTCPYRVIDLKNAGAKLTITDGSDAGTGRIYKDGGEWNGQGSLIWFNAEDCEVTLIAGTLDGTGHANTGSGGLVLLDKTGNVFTMHGGTITGGNFVKGSGGNLYIVHAEAEAIIKGGTISNGVAKNGGNIANKGSLTIEAGANISGGTASDNGGNVNNEANATISGGTFNQGVAKVGGSIANKGSLTIEAGTTISGGRSTGNGGNIWMGSQDATLEITGGSITGGQSTGDQGGNIFITGTVSISGATISGGSAKNGGNIGINTAHTVSIENTTISGGTVSGSGGNIRMFNNASGVLTLGQGTTITGGTAANGGSINLSAATINIEGANISGGNTAEGDGGNIRVESGTLNVKSGTVSGGTAGDQGGNIYSAGTLNVSGGNIQNGTAKYAGNIYVAGGKLTISGATATISGGTATNNGGSIHIGANAELEMTGGTVTGGSTNDQGGNIFISGQASITGGTVTLGTANHGGNIAINSKYDISFGATDEGETLTISSGTANGNGGNIAVNTTNSEGTVAVTGNISITGGTAGKGGNIYLGTNISVYAANLAKVLKGELEQGKEGVLPAVSMTISGGTVSGGTANQGSNIYVSNTYAYGYKMMVEEEVEKDGQTVTEQVEKTFTLYLTAPASLTISGGQIAGGVLLCSGWDENGTVQASSVDVTLSGEPVVSGDGISLNGAKLNIPTELGDGASVYVTYNSELSNGQISNTTVEANKAHIISAQGLEILYRDIEGGTLWLGEMDCLCRSPKGQCLGGDACDGTLLYWQPWTAGSSLPAEDGNYYLLGNVTLGSQWRPPADSNIALDLNGYEVTCPYRVIDLKNAGAKLTITDDSDAGTGRIYKDGGEWNGQGSLIWFNAEDCEVTLIAGTLDGTGSANTHGEGGLVLVNETGTFNMYGGSITGGNFTKADGDNVTSYGKLNLYGGTIAGAVYVDRESAEVNLSGSPVVSGDGITLNDVKLTIDGELGESASVHVTKPEGGEISGITTEANVSKIISAHEYMDVVFHETDAETHEGTLWLGKWQCFCGAPNGTCLGENAGCDGVVEYWQPWLSTKSVPDASGNYFLSGDVVLTGNGPTLGDGDDIAIDLNGYNIISRFDNKTAGAGRIYSSNGLSTGSAKIAFTNVYTGSDTTRTGDIIIDDSNRAEGDGGDQGRVVWANSGNVTINIYNVDIDLTQARTDANKEQVGIAFFVGSGRSLSLYNVNITGNSTGAAAGPVIYAENNSTVKLHNSTITNHKGSSLGGGIYVKNYNANASLILSGTSYVSGNVDASGNASNIVLPSGYVITIAEGYTGTNGQITGITAAQDQVVSNVTTAAAAAKFQSDVSTMTLGLNYQNKLVMGKSYCLCGENPCVGTSGGCDGTALFWQPWTSASTLPTSAGNFYLKQNVKLTTQCALEGAGNGNPIKIVSLDLNGWEVYNDPAKKMRLIKVSGTNLIFNLVDSVGTGQMKNTSEEYTGEGGIIWVSGGNSTTNLINAKLNASEHSSTNQKGGGAICLVGANSSFNMYGGTILGGTASQGGAIAGTHASSAVNIRIYGGTISGGNVTGDGGNIYVGGNSKVNLTITGGTISGGRAANGGNIYCVGTITMSGGTVTGGTATNGGNVYAAGTLNLSGGTISGGTATDGGDVYVAGTMTMNGGTITRGEVVNEETKEVTLVGEATNGGHVYVASGATLNLNAGTISNGVATEKGGNIYNAGTLNISGTSTTVTENEETVVTWSTNLTGGTALNGGSIYNSGSLTINGGIVSGGIATTAGGNIYADGTVVMNGGLISEGQVTSASSKGGNVFVIGNFTMNHGTVENGEALIYDGETAAKGWGGNFEVSGSGVLTINGTAEPTTDDKGNTIPATVISGGRATKNGGNIRVDGAAATLYIYGGKIIDGESIDDQGGNIFTSGTLTIQGTATNKVLITDGEAKNGGNIAINSTKNVTIANTTIQDGEAENGGNIRINSSQAKPGVVTLGQGTTISGGKARVNGGNIIVQLTSDSVKAKLTIAGATINAADEDSVGDAFRLNGKTTNGLITLTLTSGAVNVPVVVSNDTVTVNVSGTPTATLNLKGQVLNVTGALSVTDEAGVTTGANITVVYPEGTVTGDQFLLATGNNNLVYADKDRITCAVDGYKKALLEDGNLYLVPNGTHVHCRCAGTIVDGTGLAHGETHNCVDLIYTAIPADFNGGTMSARNDWYLDRNVTVTGGEFKTSGFDLNLCLNGWNFIDGKDRVLIVNNGSSATITTCDPDYSPESSEENRIVVQNSSMYDGAIRTQTGRIDFFRGIIDAKNRTLKGNQNANKDGTIQVTNANDVIVQYPGTTIIGGTCAQADSGTGRGYATISVRKNTNYYMLGGTIKDGRMVGDSSKDLSIGGGNVYVGGNGTFHMYDGTISGGDAEYAWGGNVFVAANGTFNMYDGTIADGYGSKYHGANVYLSGTFNMYDGTIEDGEGFNVNNTGNCQGGNVAMNSSSAVFNMYDGTIQNGKVPQWGGNVYIQKGTFNMYDGLITGGTANNSADNVTANVGIRGGGTLNVSGGTIPGRVAACRAEDNPDGVVNISGTANIVAENTNYLRVTNLVINVDKLDAEEGTIYLTGVTQSTTFTVKDDVILDSDVVKSKLIDASGKLEAQLSEDGKTITFVAKPATTSETETVAE